MTDDDRPTRRPLLLPQEPEVVRITEDEQPITQRTLPMPPRLRPLTSMQVPRGTSSSSYLETQIGGVQTCLSSMAARQEEIVHVVDQRLALFHQELALTRHDVATIADRVDELRTLVKDDHEKRIAKVEHLTAGQVMRTSSKYGGLLLLGGLISEVYPQFRNIINAVLGVLAQ